MTADNLTSEQRAMINRVAHFLNEEVAGWSSDALSSGLLAAFPEPEPEPRYYVNVIHSGGVVILDREQPGWAMYHLHHPDLETSQAEADRLNGPKDRP